jgi:hypothetical protein
VTPIQFLAKAGASDKFEFSSAKLETSSANPSIAQFANQMITDHTKSTEVVKSAAAAGKLMPKLAMLTAKQTSDLTALNGVKARAWEALDLKQQKRLMPGSAIMQNSPRTNPRAVSRRPRSKSRRSFRAISKCSIRCRSVAFLVPVAF